MKRSLFGELKRRNVFRAAVLYVGVVWALSQGAAQLLPVFDVPNWAVRWFIVAAVVGFPFWVVFAWFFELTPEGLKLERDVAPGESIARQTGRKLDFWIIGVMAVAIVLLLTDRLLLHRGESDRPVVAAPKKSIAVLPFENLSNDKDNEYFVAGMQDLILTKLADIGELKVISRMSTAKYASHPDNLKAIAAQLGVVHVLEGSVQKAGNSVLINVQLVDADTDAHVWAQAYTRTLDNVFGVEGEVAEKVGEALRAKFAPAETLRLATTLTSDLAANDLFLRADYLANRGRANSDTALWRQAIPLYRETIAKAPDFALARARLSFVESLLAWYAGGGEDVKQLNADARAQGEQALALAPDLAEAYLAIGYCDYYGRGDYEAALKSFAAALAARPNYVDAVAARGYVLRRQGHLDEGIDALKQALALDPRNLVLGTDLGDTYVTASRFAEAQQAYQHVLALDPDNAFIRVRYSRAIFLASGGDAARAMAEVQGDDPQLREERATFLVYQRKYGAALALLNDIPDTPDNFYVGSKMLWQAGLHSRMGDSAQARVLYAKALPLVRARLDVQVDDILLAQVWNDIAFAELGLDHTEAALAAVEKSQSLTEHSPNRTRSQELTTTHAAFYTLAGRTDMAVPLLARILASGRYPPFLLWVSDDWDPIRQDPGFQSLLKKYEKYRPPIRPAEPAGGAAR